MIQRDRHNQYGQYSLPKQKEIEESAKDIVEKIKDSLGERVEDVRVSHRLTSSPACI